MGEDVGIVPTEKVKLGARRQKGEARCGVIVASVAYQPVGELIAQCMQVKNVGCGIFELRWGECFSCPV